MQIFAARGVFAVSGAFLPAKSQRWAAKTFTGMNPAGYCRHEEVAPYAMTRIWQYSNRYIGKSDQCGPAKAVLTYNCKDFDAYASVRSERDGA